MILTKTNLQLRDCSGLPFILNLILRLPIMLSLNHVLMYRTWIQPHPWVPRPITGPLPCEYTGCYLRIRIRFTKRTFCPDSLGRSTKYISTRRYTPNTRDHSPKVVCYHSSVVWDADLFTLSPRPLLNNSKSHCSWHSLTIRSAEILPHRKKKK